MITITGNVDWQREVDWQKVNEIRIKEKARCQKLLFNSLN